jgi:capsular polysaccharide biosynthesis protein
MKKRREEITFKDILSVFIPKIWVIAIASILLASVFAIYSSVIVDDTYTSYSVMSVRKDTEALQITDIALAESTVEKISYRITSPDFLNKLLLYVNENYQRYDNLTLSRIASSIRYTPLGNGVLRVSVTTDNAQLSFAIAQALENELPGEFYTSLPNALVESYSSALFPSANSKGVVKNAIIGFFIGAVISAAAIWVISILDSTIRDKKKIEDTFDVSVIGVIPRSAHESSKKEA